MFDLQKYKPGKLCAVVVAGDWMSARLHGQEIRRLIKEADSTTTTLSWLDKALEEHERYYYDVLCGAEIAIPEEAE